MKTVTILNPGKLIFGIGSFEKFIVDLMISRYMRIFLVTFPQILPKLDSFFADMKRVKKQIFIDDSIKSEPTVSMFNGTLANAKRFESDCIIGLGGGSVLDVAKLLAALLDNEQTIDDIYGIGELKSRSKPLICLPTTAGTGSEMSPNAILLDEKIKQKKGVVSPYLVPDASYIDPTLTISVPPDITATTGLDALTHCIEAYTNKFSHPLIDRLALEGIRLIGRSLVKIYKDGADIDARSDLALGSMYGGMCLGPVNTAAVHALSYPLGSTFKIPHGMSNALLLPYVMQFNLPSCVDKYAKIALKLGVKFNRDSHEMAKHAIKKVEDIISSCHIPLKLSAINIPQDAIPRLAESAITIQRLLVNNPREVSFEDVVSLYRTAF